MSIFILEARKVEKLQASQEHSSVIVEILSEIRAIGTRIGDMQHQMDKRFEDMHRAMNKRFNGMQVLIDVAPLLRKPCW